MKKIKKQKKHLFRRVLVKADPFIKKKDAKEKTQSFSLSLLLHAKKVIPVYIILLLFFVYLSLLVSNSVLQNRIVNLQLKNSNIAFVKSLLPMPQVLGETRNQVLKSPDISAKAAVIMDDDSKTIIYGKNEMLRFSTASTAKIMTALTALELFKLNDVLSVKSVHQEGAVLGLALGDLFSFENLLYAMLLPSANDAAYAIAENAPGGAETFVEKMNQNASILHLATLHFSDPAGLQDEGDYTSAWDLARLASIAMKNSTFARVVSTKRTIISTIDGKKSYPIANLNKLLDMEGVDGIKTGFTQEAGGVLVTSKVQDGHRFIIVVMRSEDRFADTQKLLSFLNRVQFIK